MNLTRHIRQLLDTAAMRICLACAAVFLFCGRADATYMSYAFTNQLGQGDTNELKEWQVSGPTANADGSFTTIGLPIRIRPAADGQATNFIMQGNWFVTNAFLGKGIYFGNFPQDNGPTVYRMWDYQISGANLFVTRIVGNTNAITKGVVTNALGYLPVSYPDLLGTNTANLVTTTGLVTSAGIASTNNDMVVSNALVAIVISTNTANLVTTTGLVTSAGVASTNNAMVVSNALVAIVISTNTANLVTTTGLVTSAGVASTNNAMVVSNALVAIVISTNTANLVTTTGLVTSAGIAATNNAMVVSNAVVTRAQTIVIATNTANLVTTTGLVASAGVASTNYSMVVSNSLTSMVIATNNLLLGDILATSNGVSASINSRTWLNGGNTGLSQTNILGLIDTSAAGNNPIFVHIGNSPALEFGNYFFPYGFAPHLWPMIYNPRDFGLQSSVNGYANAGNFIGTGGAVSVGSSILGGDGNVIQKNARGYTAAMMNTIVNGWSNQISDSGWSTIANGRWNTISNSDHSFAAGTMATIVFSNTFVWNDTTNIFSNTAPNQVLLHASRGVGINTNNPGTDALRVNGNFDASSISIGGVPISQTAGSVGAGQQIMVTTNGTAYTVALNPTNITSQQLFSLGGNTNYLAQGLNVIGVIGGGSFVEGTYERTSLTTWTNRSAQQNGQSAGGIISNGISFFLITSTSATLYSAPNANGPWSVVSGSTPVPSSWIGASNQVTGLLIQGTLVSTNLTYQITNGNAVALGSYVKTNDSRSLNFTGSFAVTNDSQVRITGSGILIQDDDYSDGQDIFRIDPSVGIYMTEGSGGTLFQMTANGTAVMRGGGAAGSTVELSNGSTGIALYPGGIITNNGVVYGNFFGATNIQSTNVVGQIPLGSLTNAGALWTNNTASQMTNNGAVYTNIFALKTSVTNQIQAATNGQLGTITNIVRSVPALTAIVATNAAAGNAGNIVSTNDTHPSISISGTMYIAAAVITNLNVVVTNYFTNAIGVLANLNVTNRISTKFLIVSNNADIRGTLSADSLVVTNTLVVSGTSDFWPQVTIHDNGFGRGTLTMHSDQANELNDMLRIGMDDPNPAYYWDTWVEVISGIATDSSNYESLFDEGHNYAAGFAGMRFNASSPYQGYGDGRTAVDVSSDYGTNGYLGTIWEFLPVKGQDAGFLPSGTFGHPLRLSDWGAAIGAIPESIHTIYAKSDANLEVIGIANMPEMILDESGSDDPVNLVPIGSTYDGDGNFVCDSTAGISGISGGLNYTYDAGDNDTSYSLGNDGLTSNSRTFVMLGGQLILQGTAGQPVTAVVMLQRMNGELRNTAGLIYATEGNTNGVILIGSTSQRDAGRLTNVQPASIVSGTISATLTNTAALRSTNYTFVPGGVITMSERGSILFHLRTTNTIGTSFRALATNITAHTYRQIGGGFYAAPGTNLVDTPSLRFSIGDRITVTNIDVPATGFGLTILTNEVICD